MTAPKTCSFTGHRPEKLPWGSKEQHPDCISLKLKLKEEIEMAIEEGYTHFLCGMARGADLYFAEIVLLIKKQYPHISLGAVIPYEAQADYYPYGDKKRYANILAACEFEIVVQRDYSTGCLQRRNRYLVDHATRIIAVYNGKGGGTLNTLVYAMEQKLAVSILDV